MLILPVSAVPLSSSAGIPESWTRRMSRSGRAQSLPLTRAETGRRSAAHHTALHFFCFVSRVAGSWNLSAEEFQGSL